MKRCISVIGMHRSGTSAITKSLETIGVNLGTNLIPPDENNQKGFFEDTDVFKLNDEILSLAGMLWSTCSEFPQKTIETDKGKILQKKLKDLILNRVNQFDLWGVKDPRLCILLFLWKDIFKDLNIDTNYIFVLRNPLDVCKSLNKRNNFDIVTSQLLWLIYNFQAFKNLKNEKVAFVYYDDFLSNPDFYINIFCQKFNLSLNQKMLDDFKNNFIDKNLRKSFSSNSELNANNNILPYVKKFYGILLSSLKNQNFSLPEEWNTLEEEYTKSLYSTITNITHSRVFMTTQMETCKKILSDNKILFDDNKRFLEENTKLLDDNKLLLKDNSRLLDNNKELLKDNNKLLNDNNLLLKDNIKLLDNNKALLNDNKKLLDDNNTIFNQNKYLEEKISFLNNTLNMIYSSKSWKLIKILKKLKSNYSV